jgi:hypothetical protein
MKRIPKRTRAPIAAILASLTLAAAAFAGTPSTFALEVEAGPVWQTTNDIQIPNSDAGTRFSLVDLVGKGPETVGRAYLTWNIDEKNSLRGLYAPLTLTENGVPDGDIAFNGDDFLAGREATATYKFNSYRLTYSYLWRDGDTWDWRIGFTAKIRDAKVQLVQDGVDSTKDDVGFVPLLHIAGRARLGDAWYFNLDLDALAGGPGRAEDVALKLGRRFGSNLAWELGYRTVEGGADVDSVYSFAWLHYAVTSIRLEF